MATLELLKEARNNAIKEAKEENDPIKRDLLMGTCIWRSSKKVRRSEKLNGSAPETGDGYIIHYYMRTTIAYIIIMKIHNGIS